MVESVARVTLFTLVFLEVADNSRNVARYHSAMKVRPLRMPKRTKNGEGAKPCSRCKYVSLLAVRQITCERSIWVVRGPISKSCLTNDPNVAMVLGIRRRDCRIQSQADRRDQVGNVVSCSSPQIQQ